MSKLKNIKALRDMMAGNHRTQTKKTFGYRKKKEHKIREVGETWEEEINGTTFIWEQKEGYRVKRSKNAKVIDALRAELNSFPNCPKETCTCTNPTRLDRKFRRFMGICFDCNLKRETALQIQGKYEEYAKNKMKTNAEAFFKQADKEVEILKKSLSEKIGYVNEDGSEEIWESTDQAGMIRRIDEDYNDLKDFILNGFDEEE